MTVALEVIGFIITSYGYPQEDQWHEYLWYIPTAVNAFRGIGVFLILVVLPKDSRYYTLDLVSSLWEKCGGKPLRDVLPSTRRSSTSTNTTATTMSVSPLSPAASGDKERISLSSSDTQLSSHTASMSELHELPKTSENSQGVPVSSSTSLTKKSSSIKSSSSKTGDSKSSKEGKSLKKKPSNSDENASVKSSSKNENYVPETFTANEATAVTLESKENEKNDAKANANGDDRHDVQESIKNISESYPKKSSLGMPMKPPRKSLDLSARASLSLENLPDSLQQEGHAPATPPKTPTTSHDKDETSVNATKDPSVVQSDSSPDTPPDSVPPSPPTSPPPPLQLMAIEIVSAVEDSPQSQTKLSDVATSVVQPLTDIGVSGEESQKSSDRHQPGISDEDSENNKSDSESKNNDRTEDHNNEPATSGNKELLLKNEDNEDIKGSETAETKPSNSDSAISVLGSEEKASNPSKITPVLTEESPGLEKDL